MAAPLGFKDFSTGDILTAADVDGYLMQGIWVFANATARDAAVISPQEGNCCYLKDTDVIQVYSGSSWVIKSGGSPLTTKGDLYTYSTTDARLAIGTNGFVLQADSTASTGNKWTAAGRYLLASGSLSSNNLDLQNISQNYLHLELILRNYYGSADQAITAIINNDSAANQYGNSSNAVGNFTYNAASLSAVFSYDNTNQNNFAMLTFADYTGSTQKAIYGLYNSTDNTNSQRYGGFYQTMVYKGTTAISRITLNTSTGTWSGGTYELYGVK